MTKHFPQIQKPKNFYSIAKNKQWGIGLYMNANKTM